VIRHGVMYMFIGLELLRCGCLSSVYFVIIIIIIIIIYLTANGLSPGGSGYNACT
jgi:hypothetical protein